MLLLYNFKIISGGVTFLSILNYISIIAVPFVIAFIIAYGASEKIKVFDSFLVRCKKRH